MRKLIVTTSLGLVLSGCGLLKFNVNSNLGSSSSEADPANGGEANTNGEGRGSGTDPKAAAQQAERDANKKKREARQEMLELVKKIDKHITSTGDAIAQSDLNALHTKAEALGKLGDVDGKAFAAHQAKSYRIENAWRVAADEPGAVLGKELAATMVASGQFTEKEKPVSMSFNAKAGHCYYALSHLEKDGGDKDRLSRWRFDAMNDSPLLQRFRVHVRGKSYLFGMCALKDTQATATVTLQFAGTQNALRYVVLEAPRSEFSEYVALNLEVEKNDSCDAANWESLWTNPIPGSVVYGKTAPFLPYSVGDSGEMWMTAYAADDGDARLMRKDLSSKAPGSLKFDAEVRFKGCPKEKSDAHSPLANQVAACYERLHSKYDPQYDAVNAVLNNSNGALARFHARRRKDQINAQWDNDEKRTCDPLVKKAKDEWNAAYNRIVDFYGATPYAAPFDRALAMRQTYHGSYNSN